MTDSTDALRRKLLLGGAGMLASSMGGLAQHGLGRDLVSGRVAGLHAGKSPSVSS